MASIDDLIRYENENTALDFKAAQYRTAAHDKLLTDILAFANADTDANRYIIVGVKHKPGGERTILGIDETFVDSAVYQQLVRENIEPELAVDYAPFEIDGKRVAVLSIAECDNPPYLMRKDFGSLKRGDGFIRKGSHQPRLVREDFERMYAKRAARLADLGALVTLSFDVPGDLTRLTVAGVRAFDLSSDRAAAKINRILSERREKFGPSHIMYPLRIPVLMGGSIPYEQRETAELEEDLAGLKKTYADHDKYDICERSAAKLNINVANAGDRYVEDATLVVEIPKRPGLIVVPKIHERPVGNAWMAPPRMDLFNRIAYPSVEESATQVTVTAAIKAIKHRQKNLAFGERLRVVVGAALIGDTIPLHCTLYAKNLARPVEQDLSICVVEPEITGKAIV